MGEQRFRKQGCFSCGVFFFSSFLTHIFFKKQTNKNPTIKQDRISKTGTKDRTDKWMCVPGRMVRGGKTDIPNKKKLGVSQKETQAGLLSDSTRTVGFFEQAHSPSLDMGISPPSKVGGR